MPVLEKKKIVNNGIDPHLVENILKEKNQDAEKAASKPDAAENKGVSKMEAPEKKDKLINREADKQINLFIKAEIYSLLKEFCAENEITISAGFRKLVREGLEQWKTKKTTE